MAEVLVVLRSNLGPSERDAARRLAPPGQSISDRVFVSDVPATAMAGLRALASVFEPGTAPDTTTLNQSEALFANAWHSRQTTAKQRRGEGLDWDAPGFEPPDPHT
jgi:hypothetical protein